jgi:hypothetical protein
MQLENRDMNRYSNDIALEPAIGRQRLARAPKMERIYQALAAGTPLAVIAHRERMRVATVSYWLLEDFDFRDAVRAAMKAPSQRPKNSTEDSVFHKAVAHAGPARMNPLKCHPAPMRGDQPIPAPLD